MTKSLAIGRGGKRPNQTGRPPKVGTPAPTPFNARGILETIASDPVAPATARVAACKALLASTAGHPAVESNDPITIAALRLLNGGKR
jgi:hypothetical protein